MKVKHELTKKQKSKVVMKNLRKSNKNFRGIKTKKLVYL